MKKVAFLSIDNVREFEYFDHLLFEPLNKLGWDVEEVSWRKEFVNWNNYTAVIVRSTWDYQSDPQNFLRVLEQINKSSAHLENNISILKWNMNKSYLYDLEKNGVRIVKTLWQKSFDSENAEKYFEHFNVDEIIIKPNISACAENTFRLNKDNYSAELNSLKSIFANRDFMVQPFMKSIIEEGEYSLLFFDGNYSHTNLKKPKKNDFRVQAEHGGIFTSVKPSERMLLRAKNIISKINPTPLYGRVDLVRTDDDDFALMELELIEPSLYLQVDEEAPDRFAKAFDKRMKNI